MSRNAGLGQSGKIVLKWGGIGRGRGRGRGRWQVISQIVCGDGKLCFAHVCHRGQYIQIHVILNSNLDNKGSASYSMTIGPGKTATTVLACCIPVIIRPSVWSRHDLSKHEGRRSIWRCILHIQNTSVGVKGALRLIENCDVLEGRLFEILVWVVHEHDIRIQHQHIVAQPDRPA